MKNVLKSLITIGVAAAAMVGSTGAYFTSSVSANNNQIVAGTLRLAIDSSRTHTTASTWNGGIGPFGAPFDSYVVAYDNNGVNLNLNPLEPWTNAAPGPYAAYNEVANGANGADTLADGNHSWWVSLRNFGTIPMKAKLGVNGGGTWTVNPAVEAANPGVCTSANLNLASNTVTVKNVTFYGTTGGSNICKGNEECENIYFGLVGLGGWAYSSDSDIAGADVSVSGPSVSTAYASADGTNATSPIVLGPNQFVIARVDGNFDTSDNCFQGATYTYNVTGNGYQVGDTW